MMVLLKFIGLFTFSNRTGINKGVCGLWPFVVGWQHFHVAGCNFDEILQHLRKKSARKIFYLVECDGWPFVCVKLVGMGF